MVEDDERQRGSIIELIGSGEDVEISGVATSEAALDQLAESRFDCMVLDLSLPHLKGFDLLEVIKKDERLRDLPVIVYTGKDLTAREEKDLKEYAEAIIVKDASSPERLLGTSLYLHRPEARLSTAKRRMLEGLHDDDEVFGGKKVLLVDDDVRNVFALASLLESRGMEILFAENGLDAIKALQDNPDVDLVLMDIMMPEMDGYEATRRIREMDVFKRRRSSPLTAKAMKGRQGEDPDGRGLGLRGEARRLEPAPVAREGLAARVARRGPSAEVASCSSTTSRTIWWRSPPCSSRSTASWCRPAPARRR